MWTESQIPNLSNRTILITGANTGLGFEATKLLAKHGAQIILACRNTLKMSDATAKIRQDLPTASLVETQLDVSDLNSVHAFPQQLRAKSISKIDVLILNAGVFLPTFRSSNQGLETMFATNVLGHWLLTGLLLPMMKHVPGSRIISVSSIAHGAVKSIDFQLAKGFAPHRFRCTKVYSETKLANLWFMQMLQRRLEEEQLDTDAIACHPGVARTEISRYGSSNFLIKIVEILFRPFAQDAYHGCLPIAMAATDLGVKGGNFYGPRGCLEIRGSPKSGCRLSKRVFNEGRQMLLWKVCEDITGFQYNF